MKTCAGEENMKFKLQIKTEMVAKAIFIQKHCENSKNVKTLAT